MTEANPSHSPNPSLSPEPSPRPKARPKRGGLTSLSTPLIVAVALAACAGLGIWQFAPAGPGIRTGVELRNSSSRPTSPMRVVGPTDSVEVPSIAPGASRRVTLVDSTYGDISVKEVGSNLSAVVLASDAKTGTTGVSGTIRVEWTGATSSQKGATLGSVSTRSLRFAPSRGVIIMQGATSPLRVN
jgi:hypothetical protein